jgi:putative membrane protein
MHDGGTGWWIFGAVWMTLFWGTIIGLIAWAISRLTAGGTASTEPQGGPGDSALDIAKKRYARGEISREEFERLRQDLS